MWYVHVPEFVLKKKCGSLKEPRREKFEGQNYSINGGGY
jgi:hypothetical protein